MLRFRLAGVAGAGLGLLFLGAGCVADYRIESPNVSVVLAQGDGPALYRAVRRSGIRPVVARHDWGLLSRHQMIEELAKAGPQQDAVIVVGAHPKNFLTWLLQDLIMRNHPGWLAYKTRIYPHVTDK